MKRTKEKLRKGEMGGEGGGERGRNEILRLLDFRMNLGIFATWARCPEMKSYPHGLKTLVNHGFAQKP